MTDFTTPVPSSVRWMRVLVVIVLVGVACYTGFMMLERTGSTSTVLGAVVGKRHVAAHQTYVTEIINGRSVVVPRTVADAFVVDFAVPGGQTAGVVPQELYDHLRVGETLTVQVRRRRLSGAIDVLSVSR